MMILSRHARPLRVSGLALAGGVFGLGLVASGGSRDNRAASASAATAPDAETGAGKPEPQSLGTKLMNQLEGEKEQPMKSEQCCIHCPRRGKYKCNQCAERYVPPLPEDARHSLGWG